jgi:hypothetical protein
MPRRDALAHLDAAFIAGGAVIPTAPRPARKFDRVPASVNVTRKVLVAAAASRR